MNLEKTLATMSILAGGPGSGCHGPNCGRPRSDHKLVGRGYWGYSHGTSFAMSGYAAKLMGIEGYRYRDDMLETPEKNDVKKILQAIANDTKGSPEKLYHGFQNIGNKEWKIGDTIKLSLTATSGDDHTYSYGLRLDPKDQEGPGTMYEFPVGTQLSLYGRNNKEDAKEFGYKYTEAIVAGEFKITGLRTIQEDTWRHRDIQVVQLEPVKVFDPVTNSWKPSGKSIQGGGEGSGCHGPNCGRKKGLSERAQRAKASYNPSTLAKQIVAAEMQIKVAKTVHGVSTDDSQPFDVLKAKSGIEVKTIVDGINDKITMHKSSLARKLAEAKDLGLKRTYTVAIDKRNGKEEIYYKKGLGSFRLPSMTRVSSWDDLSKVIK